MFWYIFDIKYAHYQVEIILYNFYYIIIKFAVYTALHICNISSILLFSLKLFNSPLSLTLVSLKTTLSSLYKNYVCKAKFIIKLKHSGQDTHTDS